jgi:NAD(P)-dependent dehydrogenase (short-subunit alcohol dehydrogenase family)
MEASLRERSVVILGAVGATLQNITMGLTQAGADVALVDSDADKMSKFCENVSAQKAANSKFGRAGAFKYEKNNSSSLREALGKAAQTFGGFEIFIDANLENRPTPFFIGDGGASENALSEILQTQLLTSLQATEFVAAFLKTRKRGRIVYLLNDSTTRSLPVDALGTVTRMGLVPFAKTLSKQMAEFHVTVNCLSLSLTEEYLLGHFPETSSLKEAQEKMKAIDPGSLRITEPDKICQSLVYLCGSAGAAVTGQHIVLS